MDSRTDFDITHYSFDEFVSFVFEHDVAAEHETEWYWKIPDVTFAPQQICAYYVQLFRKPEFLLERFSKPQLEQGFWAIFSAIHRSTSFAERAGEGLRVSRCEI
jgi:hypothetical protein